MFLSRDVVPSTYFVTPKFSNSCVKLYIYEFMNDSIMDDLISSTNFRLDKY